MEEIVQQYLHSFALLRQGTNEAVQQATAMCEVLNQSPDSIFPLIHILLTNSDRIIKTYASNYLAIVVSKSHGNIGDPASVIQQLLQAISKEEDPKQQLLIINVIFDISLNYESVTPMILEFAKAAAESAQPHLLIAAVQLCNRIPYLLEDADIKPYYEFFCQLINASLPQMNPKYPLKLAVTLGSFVTENDAFLSQVWEAAIDFMIQHLADEKSVFSIAKILISAMNPEDFNVMANPYSIYSKVFPNVGVAEIPFEINNILLIVLNSALELIDDYSQINVEEFFPALLQKALTISAQAYNPEDCLAISRIDVFEDICVPFSDSELDTSDVFVSALMSMLEAAYSTEQTRPGIILALSYVVGDDSEIIDGNLDSIIGLLTNAIKDPVLLVRDAACKAIHEIACKFDENLDLYLESLVNSCIESICQYGPTKDIIKTLSDVLSCVLNTDPVFEKVYTLLVPQISSFQESDLSLVIPCLRELLCNSQRMVKNVINEMTPTLFSILQSQQNPESTGLLISPTIDFLASLSSKEPELFSPYLEQLIPVLSSCLSMADELKIIALLALGKLMDYQAENLLPILPELTPKLLELGSVDKEAELREGVQEQLQNLRTLEQTGELSVDFDLPGEEEDDDENAKLAPIALPALSLALFAKIALKFTNILSESIVPAMKALEVQMKSKNSDSLFELCGAISILARAISKTELPNKNDFAKQFAEWTLLLLESDNDVVVSESVAALGQIIELFGIEGIGPENQQKLIEFIQKVLHKQCPFMKGKTGYVKEFHEPFATMVCELIASYGGAAPEALKTVLQDMYSAFPGSKSKSFREIGYRIFGELVYKSGPQLPPEVKQNFFLLVINGIRSNSQYAAFALNQYTNGAPEIIMENMQHVLELLLDKLKNPPKRGGGDLAFIDNVVAAIGEIRRIILKDEFPIQQFAQLCLNNMPAQNDTSVNLDMMYFYEWMAAVMSCKPVETFATIPIKLFMLPSDQIGAISEDDSGILQRIGMIMVQCLAEMRQGAEAFILNICENDPIKAQRVQQTINSVSGQSSL